MKQIYLDYAAATPMDIQVMEAMEPFYSVAFHNPSALYAMATQARIALDSARAVVAAELGVKSAEIIFTSGGSEANNLAILGISNLFKNSHLIVSGVEHESVVAPAQMLASSGHSLTIVPPDRLGRIDPKKVVELVTDNTSLVSVIMANNEIGTTQPIAEIAQALDVVKQDRQARAITLPLIFHTDACQAGNYLALNPNRLGVDLMTINAGKLYGPKQVGVLFVRAGVILRPIVYGGGQERGLRSGTENVSGAVGLSVALKKAGLIRKAESHRLTKLQAVVFAELQGSIPGLMVNGSTKYRLPNNIHITIPGHDNERLQIELDNRGIMVATGSACHASSELPSRVLNSIGMNEAQARSSLRITMGRATTHDDMIQLASHLKKLVL